MTKKLLLFLGLLTCSLPSWASWTLIQKPVLNPCSTNPCNLTVSSTGSGHVIVVWVISSVNQTISSVSGGGTYIHCLNCAAGNGTTGYVDMSYTTSSTSGTTSISITMSSSSPGAPVGMYEFSTTGTPAFDVSGSLIDSSNCTSCLAPSLTQTGTNDAGVGVASCGQACSGVSGSGWTNDNSNPTGDGVISTVNMTSFVRPSFTQSPTGQLTSAMILINDGGASTLPLWPHVVIY